MQKLTKRKERVLEALDEEIEDLEERLRKVQPLIDELNQLKKTRATLLSERTTTGSVGRSRITMESIIHALRTHGPMTPVELAGKIGEDDTAIRSHLNRHKDVRYAKNGDGKWSLIGELQVEEEEEDEEE